MCVRAEEAGLAMCDLRVSYSEGRSSTPIKGVVCSNDNMDCWNGGYNASKIARPTNDNNSDFKKILDVEEEKKYEDISLDAPRDPERECEVTRDDSYEWWDGRPLSSTSSPTTSRVFYDRGVSLFDTTMFQVLSNSFKSARNADHDEGTDGNNNEQRVVRTVTHIKEKLRENIKEPESILPSILDRPVLHLKSNSELREEGQKTKSHLFDFRTEELRIFVSNVRGFYSKRESLAAIAAREDIDIMCLCETFMSANRFPEVAGFTTYFRNRSKRSAGGIAILIRNEKAKFAVRLEAGKKENEFLVVKFTNCNPHLVIIVYYGSQTRIGVDNIKLHLSELLSVVKKYTSLGCTVNVVGDFNLQIGNKVITKNHPEDNPLGRLFMDMIDSSGLMIMNTMSQNPITFIDRSGRDHKESVLDLVITNHPNTISKFKTDNRDYEFTPYSVKMRKKVASRTYTDHMSIIYNVRVSWQDRVVFKKDSIWNFKKQLGDLKFHIFTSNACNFLLNKVENESDINAVHKAFSDVLTKGKYQSYGKRSVTASKIRNVNDDLVWRERISDLNRLHARFKDEKEINQIYKTRKVILKGQSDRQNMAVEVEETGEVLEDLEDVLNHILDYNVKNMQKTEPSQQVEELMNQKARVINMMLEDSEVCKFPDEIPWPVYLKVLEKVHRQKKGCFRDIIKSGRNYKYALYRLLNRMYTNEEFPEVSSVTYLVKIWKRKGNPARLKDNRFIHGKEPVSKLFEKCVVEIIAQALDEATPQLQAGSRKGRSTRDQLLKVLVMQKYFESKSKPLPVVLVDVQACFDKMVLDDVIYDTIKAGADLKATRVIRKFSDKTEIRLRGDFRNEGKGEGRIIMGTLGQGSNFAPPGIGMTTSKSLLNEFKQPGQALAKLGQVQTLPQSYVDDMATLPCNLKGVKEAGKLIGTALENISLKSHPDKTEVIVSGRNKRAVAMRERLTDSPAEMQGNAIKVSSSGMYLGMKISQEGHRDSADMTARHRIAKAWGRVAEIKSQINDAKMTSIGWLKAGITLIGSVIIPSITYSGDVWLAINKATEKYVIDEYKSMIYVILDIPTHTKWTSVLADLNLPNIIAVLDKLRINYLNHTLWGKGDQMLKDMLTEEHRLSPGNSMLSLGDEICRKYNIPPVSSQQLDKGLVRRYIRIQDEIDIWISNVKSSATQNVGAERTRVSTNMFKLTKRESQSIIALNAGALKLKTAWGDYHEVKTCLVPLCGEADELDHIKICPFYDTKWEGAFSEDIRLLAQYLVSVDRERRRRWKGECLF